MEKNLYLLKNVGANTALFGPGFIKLHQEHVLKGRIELENTGVKLLVILCAFLEPLS